MISNGMECVSDNESGKNCTLKILLKERNIHQPFPFFFSVKIVPSLHVFSSCKPLYYLTS